MLFLVSGEVIKRAYMGRDSEEQETRIVEADDYDSAIAKFANHFESMGDRYGDSYSVYNVVCNEAII